MYGVIGGMGGKGNGVLGSRKPFIAGTKEGGGGSNPEKSIHTN